jgi:exopolyphosphatase/guanosine-5'-triphosphate,3'-diphosphate pyrophosphatase
MGERWVSLPLGGLPVQALLAKHGAKAKTKVDALLREKLPPALDEPVFYAVGSGWRTFAKAHMAATQPPVQVVHGYTLDTREARAFAKKLWAQRRRL